MNRPNVSVPRPATPMGRPNPQRPDIQRPNLGGAGQGRPNFNPPATYRPSFNSPSSGGNIAGRPGGGLKPTPRPGAGSLPSNPGNTLPPRPPITGGPSVRPGASLPSVRPGTSLPNFPSRPSDGLPGLANRPSLPKPPRPGNLPGGVRPPVTGLPGNPPALPGGRPGARPTPGNVGDFLGLDRPLIPDGGLPGGPRPGLAGRPDRPVTLPGGVNRPGRPNLPNLGGRPGGAVTLPGELDRPGLPNGPWERPEIGNRPGLGNRPEVGLRPTNRPDFGGRWPDNRWGYNDVINRRPGWVNIDNSTNINIHNRWNSAFDRPGWRVPGSDRRGYWNGWADGVRHGWGHYHDCGRWFNRSWWDRHPHGLCGWHYHYGMHSHAWGYWWTAPTWGTATNWFAWRAPRAVWSEPVFYDYGAGGNVVYQDNTVYIGGAEVATAEEFAMSAMALATVAPPASEEEAAAADWLPLGTFVVSTDARETNPSLTVQLAVNRQGIVAGTLYNAETDEASSIQGAVDRQTQRVAVRFGESEDMVAETGLFNLTQPEAPLLVHFGPTTSENYLLVRLDQPTE